MKINGETKTVNITLTRRDLGVILENAATFMSTNSTMQKDIQNVSAQILKSETSYDKINVSLNVEVDK